MEIIVFEKEAYWQMQEQLITMFREAIKQAQQKPEDWISPEEAHQLLGIKSKTKMQELRNSNAIKFSKYGHKLIRYSRSSITDYLKRNAR